jgi:hypothetical protein
LGGGEGGELNGGKDDGGSIGPRSATMVG